MAVVVITNHYVKQPLRAGRKRKKLGGYERQKMRYIEGMIINQELFFLLTVEDLRQRLERGTEYDIIRSCGLCRQLLLDSKKTLLALASENFQVRTQFEIAEMSDSKAFHSGRISFNVGWMTIVPNKLHTRTRKVDKDEFLRLVLLNYHGNLLTVEDIIRAASSFMGGVHSRNPDKNSRKEMALAALYKETHKHTNITFFALKAICTVVLKAMEYLEGVIKSNTPAGGLSPQS